MSPGSKETVVRVMLVAMWIFLYYYMVVVHDLAQDVLQHSSEGFENVHRDHPALETQFRLCRLLKYNDYLCRTVDFLESFVVDMTGSSARQALELHMEATLDLNRSFEVHVEENSLIAEAVVDSFVGID